MIDRHRRPPILVGFLLLAAVAAPTIADDCRTEDSRASSCTMVSPDEPGDPLVLEATLVDPEGRPVAGARVHVYQTDTSGYYAPQDAQTGRMSERDPRLAAYLRTDDAGRFRVRTIRPGGYPSPRGDQSEDSPMRFIPAHIHVDIDAPGYVDPTVQIVFDDDPRMNEAWRAWAGRGHNPVVELTERDGVLHGETRIELERQ
jgi:protocatechuate 3,4-dioxygenase beta subunit